MKPILKTVPLFSKYQNLLQAFSTRVGGFSKAPYDSLNLGMHSGDHRPSVLQNRRLFFKELHVPEERLVFPEQIHSANVQLVKKPGIVMKCDALITSEKDLFLTIQTADCFPVFLFDPQAKAIGIVHSGWRGTAVNIVQKTIWHMEDRLNCRAENMIAAIGAGVQQSCYQVDTETASHFEAKYCLPDGPGHFKLDVQGAITDQLLTAGLRKENMEIDKTCTHCATKRYYSYRRDGKQSGRMMGVIGVRGKESGHKMEDRR